MSSSPTWPVGSAPPPFLLTAIYGHPVPPRHWKGLLCLCQCCFSGPAAEKKRNALHTSVCLQDECLCACVWGCSLLQLSRAFFINCCNFHRFTVSSCLCIKPMWCPDIRIKIYLRIAHQHRLWSSDCTFLCQFVRRWLTCGGPGAPWDGLA